MRAHVGIRRISFFRVQHAIWLTPVEGVVRLSICQRTKNTIKHTHTTKNEKTKPKMKRNTRRGDKKNAKFT